MGVDPKLIPDATASVCQIVVDFIRRNPGCSSESISADVGLPLKLTRRVLYVLLHHDERNRIRRAFNRSAYWLNQPKPILARKLTIYQRRPL